MLPPRAALPPIYAKLSHDTSGVTEMSPLFFRWSKRNAARFLLLTKSQPLHNLPGEMEPRAAQTYPKSNYQDTPYPRQCFQRAHTSVGAGSAGHWLRMAGILSPLVIGEIVKDADKRWRWIRISAVATALVSEGLYANRIRQQREEQKEHAHCR